MVKDEFIKNFTSRAFSGLQSGISSGLVDPTASGMATSGANIGTKMGNNPTTIPQTSNTSTPNTSTPNTSTPNTSTPNTSTTPTSDVDNAGTNAFGQMANQLTAKKSPEQIRQEKLAAATKTAQDQMSQNGQFSKLPTDQFNKTASNIRQQKQASATKTAQDQMSPMSKLPADQFNKTASNIRQQQQGVATQNAQDQMSPMSKLPADQFNKNASNIRQQKQAAATQTAQNQMAEPKQNIKPDNTVQMPNRNRKSKGKVAEYTQFDKLNYLFENILAEVSLGRALSPGGQVVGQANQQQTKQTISQYITNFFKQFMKGVNISDPSVMTRVSSLAKELEQTFSKDKGKSVLPKLAELGWSVQHAQAEEQPKTQQATSTTPTNPTPGSANPTPGSAQTNQASAQKTKTAYQQIQGLLKDMTPANKQKILASLQKELVTPAVKEPTVTVGKQKRNRKAVDPADAQLLATAKKQGKI
jgi:hypothetical protein